MIIWSRYFALSVSTGCVLLKYWSLFLIFFSKFLYFTFSMFSRLSLFHIAPNRSFCLTYVFLLRRDFQLNWVVTAYSSDHFIAWCQEYVACPGCGIRHVGSVWYYKSHLDTVVGLWEWKIPAWVHSYHCCVGGSDAWSGAPLEPYPILPLMEPVTCFQEAALDRRAWQQPEQSGSPNCRGSRAFCGEDAPELFWRRASRKNAK